MVSNAESPSLSAGTARELGADLPLTPLSRPASCPCCTTERYELDSTIRITSGSGPPLREPRTFQLNSVMTPVALAWTEALMQKRPVPVWFLRHIPQYYDPAFQDSQRGNTHETLGLRRAVLVNALQLISFGIVELSSTLRHQSRSAATRCTRIS